MLVNKTYLYDHGAAKEDGHRPPEVLGYTVYEAKLWLWQRVAHMHARVLLFTSMYSDTLQSRRIEKWSDTNKTQFNWRWHPAVLTAGPYFRLIDIWHLFHHRPALLMC